MNTLSGIAASRGIAIGPAFLFRRSQIKFDRYTVDDPQAEWARFTAALATAKQQLTAIHAKALQEFGPEEAAIFEAHAMILDDPELLSAVQSAVTGQGLNAEAALYDTAEMYAQMLEQIEDEYLRARAADIRDVSSRILRALLGISEAPAEGLKAPAIIVAADLTPSDTALLDKALVLGFCTAAGGATDHTAILARSLGLPAVVGAGESVMGIKAGAALVVDGGAGAVLINPDKKTVAVYEERRQAAQRIQAEALKHAGQPATTTDGHTVEVVANIGNVEDARAAVASGAEGVGLFRTEFLYLEQSTLPDEEQQYRAYKEILEQFGKQPVILRTLDIGGDKELPYLPMPHEMNPFLGLRAIRLCLAHPEVFKPQLRAALRAGVGHNLLLMFPMVATVGEVLAARELLEECRAELKRERKPAADVQVGIMVEIPSAAVIADQLARVVDFFSIGTNDLSQYTMAADRSNGAVAPLVSGFQPAVLRLVHDVIRAAHAEGKWVGMCGELAGEPLAIPILIGLELDEFSMNPPAVPIAKEIIRSLSLAEAKKLAAAVLDMETPERIQQYVLDCVPAAHVS